MRGGKKERKEENTVTEILSDYFSTREEEGEDVHLSGAREYLERGVVRKCEKICLN